MRPLARKPHKPGLLTVTLSPCSQSSLGPGHQHAHFTDEDTEAQRPESLTPGHRVTSGTWDPPSWPFSEGAPRPSRVSPSTCRKRLQPPGLGVSPLALPMEAPGLVPHPADAAGLDCYLLPLDGDKKPAECP